MVLSAFRFRSGLFAPSGGGRGEGLLRRRAGRAGRDRVRLCAQHRDRRDRPHRRQGGEAARHRFRAALRSFRARLPAAADHPSDRADRRPAARRHSRPADPRLRTPDDQRRRRLQSHPLCRRRRGDAADDQCAALLHRQRDHVSADPPAHPDLRPGRAVPQRHRRHGQGLSRADARALARLVAQPRGSVRMAVGGHSRRDHSQADQLQRDRRDRRRAHDLDPRGAEVDAQLGLPVLLAEGRLFRRRRAEPARRDADHGILHQLHHDDRHRSEPHPAGARHRAVLLARGDDRARPERVPRTRAGPGRQPGRAPDPERRLRQRRARGDADVRRRAPADHGRRVALPPAGEAGRAGAGAGVRARRGPLGISRTGARPHLFGDPVLGGLRPARPDRAAARNRRPRQILAGVMRASCANASSRKPGTRSRGL